MQKACRALGIVVHDEAVPVSDHDANGASEVTVQILRAKAGLLVQQIEDRVAAGKVIRPLLVPSSMQAGFTTGMALVAILFDQGRSQPLHRVVNARDEVSGDPGT